MIILVFLLSVLFGKKLRRFCMIVRLCFVILKVVCVLDSLCRSFYLLMGLFGIDVLGCLIVCRWVCEIGCINGEIGVYFMMLVYEGKIFLVCELFCVCGKGVRLLYLEV